MKRCVFFLLIMIIAFKASAQQSENLVSQPRFIVDGNLLHTPDSIITFDPDGNKINKTYYNKTADGLHVVENQIYLDDVSGDWINQSQIIKGVDVYGNESYREDYFWDGLQWIGSSKKINVYNERGDNLLSEDYYWDTSINDWAGSSKNIVQFDTESRVTFNELYFWENTEHKWIGMQKNLFSFDSFGNQTLFEYFQWDLEKDDWESILLTKEEFLSGTNYSLSRESYSLDHETGVLYMSDKVESIIGENGKPVETFSYYASMLGEDLRLNTKESYSYDEKDRLVRRESYKMTVDNEWIPSVKYEYTMDDEDRLLELITYRWNNVDWQGSTKETHSYYSEDGVDVDETIISIWNSLTNKWVNSTLNLAGKDSFDNLVRYENYKWNTTLGRWDGLNYFKKEYNAANLQVSILYQAWDSSAGLWVGTFKYIYVYSNDTILQRNENYKWVNGKWIGVNRYEYDYNSAGEISFYCYSRWDALADNWLYSNKNEKVYDQNHNLLTESYFIWNKSTSIWEPSYKQENQYDELGRIVRNDVYSSEGGQFNLQHYNICYYSSFAISEDNLLFEAKGETLSIDITTDAQWTVVGNAEWLTITPTSGSGNAILNFTAAVNNSTEVRTTIVEVRLVSVTFPDPVVVTVTQKDSVAIIPPVPPAPVIHTVSVLSTEGATTNPTVGSYKVSEHDSFRLDIAVKNGYDASEIALRINNEIIYSLTQVSGTKNFSYTISNITSDMEIEIIGLKYSSMVGNQDVDNDTKVYTSGNNLYIDAPAQTNVVVHTIIGQTVVNKKIPAGIASFFLPAGVYVVAVGQKVSKVIIR